MCGTKILLAFGVLLVAAYARPANAAATAQAFGNTGSGYSGIARSSATASADASAGGTANAAAEATANAFADGENIEKAISSASAIANANHPIGRSDVLDRPSDRGKDIEYKATNHQDGTPTCDQHIANAGHGGFGNKENSTPGSIDSANSATVCHPGDSKCRNSKKDHNVPSPHPTYNKPPHHLSQHNAADPESDPCAAGSQKCLESGLEGSNPNQHPHDQAKLPDVFEKSENKNRSSNPHPSHHNADPESHPCAAGSQKCLASGLEGSNPNQHPHDQAKLPDVFEKSENKERASNPHPSHHNADPESDPCAAGSEKCLESGLEGSNPNQHPHDQAKLPDVFEKSENKDRSSNPHPSHHNADPESDPCAAGSEKCLESGLEGSNPNQHPHDQAKLPDVFEKSGNKERASNPHPSHHNADPESDPCAAGSEKCLESRLEGSNPNQHPHDQAKLPDVFEKFGNKDRSSNPHPSQNAQPDFSESAALDSDWAGNTANPGSRPCAHGSPKCSTSHIPNPDQTYPGHVELPGDSEKPRHESDLSNKQFTKQRYPGVFAPSAQTPPNINSGSAKPNIRQSSVPRGCNYGNPKCEGSEHDDSNPDQSHHKHASGIPVNAQGVTNPQPSHNKHPDLSASSSQPSPKPDGSWGDNTANHGAFPCNSGSRKCSGGQLDVPNPIQPHDKHIEFAAGSGMPITKPSVSNPYPSQNEHPDLTAGSSKPFPKPDAGRGSNTANPESRPCPPGSHKCSEGQPDVSSPDQLHDKNFESTAHSKRPVTKPSVSNPYPSYNNHPDLSAGSSQPLPKPDGGWGANTVNPGSRPCTSGSRECSGDQPNVPNPNQPHGEHVALPTDSGKPSVLNPYPSYNKHPDWSAGSSQPLPNLDGGYGGHKSIKPPGEKEDAKGGHRHIPFNKNPDVSTGSSYPSPNFNGGCGGNSATPASRPCTSGSSGSEPGTSNPFLNGEIDVSEIRKAVKSGGSSPDSKPNPSNPFLNGHTQHPPTPTGSTHHSDNSNNGNPGRPSYQNPESKPNPSNPFLNNHSQHPPTPTGSSHHSGNPNDSNQGRPSDHNPASKPNPSNPFLNNHNQHPPTPTGSTHHSGNPNDSNLGRPSDQNSESKPNPLNPFLNSGSQHSPTPTGSTHNSGIPNNSVHGQPSDHYPESESNPSNPFLKPHNQHPSSSTADTHNFEDENGSDKSGPSNPYSQKSPSNPISTHHERDEVEACSRGSCKHKGPNAGTDNGSSDADQIGNRKTPGRPSNGVKTYRPGVKGDSARRPQSSPPIKYNASGDGDEASANANASWDAYSNAHASASADGDGDAHAKSQAHSSANASGWSNSWASSSASASASASSSSWH